MSKALGPGLKASHRLSVWVACTVPAIGYLYVTHTLSALRHRKEQVVPCLCPMMSWELTHRPRVECLNCSILRAIRLETFFLCLGDFEIHTLHVYYSSCVMGMRQHLSQISAIRYGAHKVLSTVPSAYKLLNKHSDTGDAKWIKILLSVPTSPSKCTKSFSVFCKVHDSLPGRWVLLSKTYPKQSH